MNIKYIKKIIGCAIFTTIVGNTTYSNTQTNPAPSSIEPVQACVVARSEKLTRSLRSQFAQCLGWQDQTSSPICRGYYDAITINPVADPEPVHISTDTVSFYNDRRSTLSGNVEVQQGPRVVDAQTAYVYRDAKTRQVTKIEFVGNVRYKEPGKLMIARSATIYPGDKSGEVVDVLYRFNVNRKSALLPAWGRASVIHKYPNKDYLLRQATYTTCAPKNKAWDIQADTITIDDAKATGVARHAKLRLLEIPVLYTPYLSFPTTQARKSGFLLPIAGYSNVGGYDVALPYYWNIAPNYDLTLVPHLFTERGFMLGGEYRYLTSSSTGVFTGDFLPHDRAYEQFLQNYQLFFPRLRDNSNNRWSWGWVDSTSLTSNLLLHVDAKQVSDDYYLQDFSTNLALVTERQLLRQIDLTYVTDHWIVRGMAQNYQTLHPINETPVGNVYERLPQILAQGLYADLPFNAQLSVLGQYDQFHWPISPWDPYSYYMPQGPRLHANPILSFPQVKPWGFITPSVQLVENYYQVQHQVFRPSTDYNLTLPRYSVDGGLFFERSSNILRTPFTQTLEPRLFYLNVPYQNQTPIPVYDSGYMIFNIGQLFRTNRFSGYDRIGDANQLAYALTTRWLYAATGAELASITVGQIKYFADRKVQLCHSLDGFCLDSPYTFGYQSPTASVSPIASYGVFNINPVWAISADYMWTPQTRSTNNGDVNLHYRPQPNQMVNFGYSYLVNGDITLLRDPALVNEALHQATISAAWPLTEKWSYIGAYSHNISKNYSMMSYLGLQYDSCCWAVRVIGGRTFKNLYAGVDPQYNNSIYLQILLKGLGSVGTGDPSRVLNTYLPGYPDQFHS